MLFDTHCHLDAEPLGAEVDAVLARAASVGVTRLLVPGVAPAQWAAIGALAERFPGRVHRALGIHPQCLPELDANTIAAGLATLEAAARSEGVVAIGECGFDGVTARDAGISLERQAEIVRVHVEVAERVGLPLIVHVVDAMGPALAFFEAHGPLRHGAVLHAFGGPAELVPRWARLGFSFGIGPSITWPRARRPKLAARAVPRDRLLLETDAPGTYVHGSVSRSGEPAEVVRVLEALASLRGEPIDELASEIRRNADRLFSRASAAPPPS